MGEFANWGDYFWPDQIDVCRKNLLGITDAAELERIERRRSATRQAELIRGEGAVPHTFDLDHLKAIHHHLFQDVYGWAGQLRVTELVRPSENPDAPGHEFVKPDDLERLAPAVFAQLGDPADLAHLATFEQVDVLARTYSGLNVLHPFVEGNGRTQRIFLRHAATAAGLELDWTKMPHQNQVMAAAFTAGPEGVAAALAPCLTPATPTPEKSAATQIGWAAARAASFPANVAGPAPTPTHASRAVPQPTRGRSSLER